MLTTTDPALTKPTFSNNKPLTAALGRIKARKAADPDADDRRDDNQYSCARCGGPITRDSKGNNRCQHCTPEPFPVISGAEVDGSDASPEPPPMKFAPLIQPAQVIVMSLSASTIKAALKYVGIVNRYEDPEQYFNSGLTAREMELVRTKAHNDLIEQLRAEGICVDDRASTTELAQRVDTWIRE